eukprot:TRINITY_DN14349_c0_g1_i2.p1 TRINITY_DN14349_c0_g1~~TRINITY_DN14349_c0_g1_i2.p1  ORF type:complete len:378 (+),score=58.87 TRINITY_DN14349_c0_g1_i2:39-1136(+)
MGNHCVGLRGSHLADAPIDPELTASTTALLAAAGEFQTSHASKGATALNGTRSHPNDVRDPISESRKSDERRDQAKLELQARRRSTVPSCFSGCFPQRARNGLPALAYVPSRADEAPKASRSNAETELAELSEKGCIYANANRLSHFHWLDELLSDILSGSVRGRALDTREKPADPLFVVAGACPNSFCGMQAVLYCRTCDAIDFWWVKPQAEKPDLLDWNTLSHNAQGPNKNRAEASRSIYAPLADMFSQTSAGDFVFGIQDGRAFIEEKNGEDKPLRMYVYFVWQEEWSSFYSMTSYVRGKLFYERLSSDLKGPKRLCARPFEIRGRELWLAGADAIENLPSQLPPDHFQASGDVASWVQAWA